MDKELGDILIFVADDDENFGEVIRSILKDTGYRVIICKNGAEAVEMAVNLIPDLIMLDLIMPVKNGWKAFKEIRKNPKTSHIKVILFSSKPQLEGQFQEADAFLQKPIPADELLETVSRLLYGKKD
jgi:twitching motility two-component system response regulator PilH